MTLTSLFRAEHLPLLAASALPALLMCILSHSELLGKRVHGFALHPLFLPICCAAVAAIFWIVVIIGGQETEALASSGWLFKVQARHADTRRGASWNYWALFDFEKVEWRVLTTGCGDMALLLLIGVLTLPIFVSIAACEVQVLEYSMNREFVGHGLLNIFIGCAGSLPASIVRLV